MSDDNRTKELKDYRLREAKIKKRKDTLTVLCILSSVAIVSLLIAWLKSGMAVIEKLTGASVNEAREIYEVTRNVLVGVGIISILIIIVYLVENIKSGNKKKHDTIDKKAFIDYDRLEAARMRVEKARMEAKDKADSDKNSYSSMKKDYGNYDIYGNRQKPDGMSDEEYRKMRKEEYERYMDMDFDEEMDEEEALFKKIFQEEFSEEEDNSFIGRIRKFFSRNGLIIGMTVGIIALLAVLAIIVISVF